MLIIYALTILPYLFYLLLFYKCCTDQNNRDVWALRRSGYNQLYAVMAWRAIHQVTVRSIIRIKATYNTAFLLAEGAIQNKSQGESSACTYQNTDMSSVKIVAINRKAPRPLPNIVWSTGTAAKGENFWWQANGIWKRGTLRLVKKGCLL